MLLQRSISVLNTCRISLYSPRILSFSATNLSSLSLSPVSFSTLINSKPHQLRALATSAAAENGSDADTFLAEESISWASLGVSSSISRALCNVGLNRPSLVQAATVPAVLSGGDVVVAAETGSGKTHGYLVPIIQKLCSKPDALHDPKLDNNHHHVSLVLCPNAMLCEQVVRMANSLCDGDGKPLLNAAAICGRQGLSVKQPDIIVSTPVALLNYLYAIDPERRRRTDFIRCVKYVVFDEADLLLCGSFQNQVIRLMHMLRFDEKQLSRFKDADSGAQDPLTSFTNASDMEEDLLEDLNLDEAEDSQERSIEDSEKNSKTRTQKDWRRVRKIYERSKQYIFVAATLPLNGKRTAGGILKHMFQDAKWINGSYLHCHNPRLEQRWIEVATDTQVDALINAVKSGVEITTESTNGVIRTMVFANTVEAAEAIANILTGAGIRCVRYHREISLEERTENLVDFQQNGGVFVCTDAAARGLDVPNVSHVIQAEFASSAVDFLHRVGRTGRAGQAGLVTSLFAEANRELVAAVRQAEEHGLPVEKAFSRKRGFRNKIKKRGLGRRDGASAPRPIPV